MSDIDFDELDRAVNDLMKDVDTTKQDEPADNGKEKTIDLPEVPAEGAVPSPISQTSQAGQVSEPQKETVPEIKRDDRSIPTEQTPVISTASSVPQRPRGRFMDIVSPSASMRSAPGPSRQGRTINPVDSSNNVTSSVAQKSPSSTPQEEVLASPSFQPNDDTIPKPEWPDPIDQLTNGKDMEKEDVLAMHLDSLQPGDEKPMSSPFLPDAKVEKRPLGMPMDTHENATISPESDPAEEKMSNEQNSPQSDIIGTFDEPTPIDQSSDEAAQTTPEVALPAELSQDVMEVESGETNASHGSDNHSEDIPNDSAVDQQDDNNQQPEKPSVSPLTAVSIPQQYQEKPHDDDEKSAPIYNTEEYAGVTHPAKHKSGWLWVVWIILLLALGAGGGAAAYLFFVQ